MTENVRLYRRIHRARGRLLIAVLETFGATATDKDLASLSGLGPSLIRPALEQLERAGHIKREPFGRKRRIEILGRKPAQPRASEAGCNSKPPAAASIAPLGLPPNRLPARRRCITCGELFHSEHAGNRMCGRCKRQAACQSTPFDI